VVDEDSQELTTNGVEQVACHACSRIVDVSKTEPFSVVECPHCGSRLSVPGKLGEFVLLKVLGKGTMGATYKAFDRTLGRHVAIKVMRKSLCDDEQLVGRFLGEARALASLNHRNVVQIYSLGREKGRPYIVMELVSGGQMAKLLEKGQSIEEKRALQIGIDAAEGLRAAYGIGLIHGDVKPGNILFDDEGGAKLVDFGPARFGGGKQEPGEGMGTPYYVAPERVQQQASDHRSDMYSLGATLFHAIAGKPPFAGDDLKDVLTARLDKPVPSLLAARRMLHPATAVVVERMLATDPEKRHQNYDALLTELREALQKVIAAANGTALPATPGRGLAARKQESKRKDIWTLIIVCAVMLIVLAAMLIILFWVASSTPAPE